MISEAKKIWVAVGFSNAQVPLVAIRMGLVASSVHFPAGHCPKGMGESKGDGLICAFNNKPTNYQGPGQIGPRARFLRFWL